MWSLHLSHTTKSRAPTAGCVTVFFLYSLNKLIILIQIFFLLIFVSTTVMSLRTHDLRYSLHLARVRVTTLVWELFLTLSPVAMGLLYTTSGRGALAGSLCCQLLTWGFASSGLTGSLLGTGHR